MRRVPVALVVAILFLDGCATPPAAPRARAGAQGPLVTESHPAPPTPHQPGPRSLPPGVSVDPALQPLADETVKLLASAGLTCTSAPAHWVFSGADAGAEIRCDAGGLRLFHYAHPTGREWEAVEQDFVPASSRGYAHRGLLMVNQLRRHHVDEALYALLDKA